MRRPPVAAADLDASGVPAGRVGGRGPRRCSPSGGGGRRRGRACSRAGTPRAPESRVTAQRKDRAIRARIRPRTSICEATLAPADDGVANWGRNARKATAAALGLRTFVSMPWRKTAQSPAGPAPPLRATNPLSLSSVPTRQIGAKAFSATHLYWNQLVALSVLVSSWSRWELSILCGHNPRYILGCVDSRNYLFVAHLRPIGYTTSTSLSGAYR